MSEVQVALEVVTGYISSVSVSALGRWKGFAIDRSSTHDFGSDAFWFSVISCTTQRKT